MSEAFMLYFNGKGDAPTAQQVDEAKRRRAVADDLFSVAIRYWGDRHRAGGPTHE